MDCRRVPQEFGFSTCAETSIPGKEGPIHYPARAARSRSGSGQPLGVGSAARGQTDLEVFVEKLLDRSDPEATLIQKMSRLSLSRFASSS